MLSTGVHCVVIVLLFQIRSTGELRPPSVADLIRAKSTKIIWYDFRKRPTVVSASERVGQSKTPRAPVQAKRAMIATSPKPKSSRQLIWQSAPKIEIERDLPLPNMVARMGIPNAIPQREEVKTVEAAPPPHIQKTPKIFTPPPRVTVLKQTVPTPLLEAPPPAVSSARSDPALDTGLSFQKNIDIPNAPVSPPPPGNGNADLAAASLRPGASQAVPQGVRPGQFAEAPDKGPISTGEVTGVRVPNLTIRDPDPAKRVDMPAPKFVTVVYAEKIRSIPTATLSAPLRPASRMIPRSMEARFQGRYVYTLVIPIENLPAYQGDWILWFAEKHQRPGDTPLMRAPVPLRKLEPAGATAARNGAEQRLQLAATITREGRIESISMLTKPGGAFEQAFIRDLASWDFKPATRDGQPVDIDVVVEIPFNLSVIAQRGQP